MSKKITVTPSEVRGWGNVIGEKTTSDYGLYDASLTSTTAVVDSRSRTVFTLGVLTNGTTCSLSAVSGSIFVGATPQLTGYLKDSENSGLSGKSVKIYQGSTLLTTVTTGSGGAFSYTGSATSSAGTLTYHAVFSGDEDYGASTSSDVTITVSKKNTSLAIDVPLVLVYSDAFNITGTLKDASNNVLNGKTVDLYVGSSKVDSGTTNSSGVVQFTQTPVHMGNHTFQLKFAGDSTYNNVDSETVTRSIGKETSVLSLSSPVNNSSVYTGESVSVSGTLTDNDGTAMTGKTIVVSEGGSQITTFTTGNGGAFSGSLSGLSTASHSLKFEFVADDYYTGSSVTRAVTVGDHTYSLTAVASSTSISVGSSVTISGNLKKDNSNWASQTITIYDGSTSLGTATTDGSGNYSKTISGLAEGQHTIKAVHTNVESSSVSVTVSQVVPSSLSVTGTKSILSYADSESSVLTATVTDSSSNPLSGQTVVFKNGSTTLDTKTTDSNGQCTYTYASTGVGDVTITVECSLLQETYALQDCHRYDNCSTDKTSNYTCGSNASLSFSTDHYVMSTTTDDIVEVLDGIDNVQFEVLLKHNSNVGGIQIRQNPSNAQDGAVGLYNNASNTTYLALFPWSNVKSKSGVTNNSDYYRYILTINGSSITARIENSGGTVIFDGSTSKSLSAKHFCIFNVGNNTLNIKEIKVKAL